MTADASEADVRAAETPAQDGGAPEAPRVKPTPAEAAHAAFETILEKKGRNVLLLDISACSDLADFMIVATATNPRQTFAIASETDRRLRASGLRRLNMAGLDLGAWAVLDYGDLFVHVLQERERRYYDLEALWADAVVVRKEAGGGPEEEEPAAASTSEAEDAENEPFEDLADEADPDDAASRDDSDDEPVEGDEED